MADQYVKSIEGYKVKDEEARNSIAAQSQEITNLKNKKVTVNYNSETEEITFS